jgi:LytS/YehU family sensor histidine kinase
MSLRKGARCTLVASGVDERALVPPALFHTLIENGLTHLLPRDGEQTFELHAERRPASIRYTLVANGEAVARAAAEDNSTREGTGLRYIKARLEESFAGQWILEGAPVPGGWRTVIQWQEQPAEARG